MAWTNIDNALVSVGALPFATTVQALRDNPIAIANGDAGAPKVQNAALATISASVLATDAAMVNWVLARTAGATSGVVGSYIVAWNYSTGSISANGTVAGSSLRYSTGQNGFAIAQGTVGAALTGTWRAIIGVPAPFSDPPNPTAYYPGFFLRIG